MSADPRADFGDKIGEGYLRVVNDKDLIVEGLERGWGLTHF